MANKGNENLKKHEASVRNRVECEEKAFHIVNNLIDGKVDGPYLISCAQLISREHYQDVVEERAISFLCGYPLCDNSLSNIPKKQYHISTSTNKVYDISERKNFCSNQCLKASKHFSNQISESPLWTRAKEPSVVIKLLPHTDTKGIVGSEVVGISPQKLLEEEIKKLEELDIRSSSLNKNGSCTTEQHHKLKPSSDIMRTTAVAANKINAISFQMPARDKKENPSDKIDNKIDNSLLKTTNINHEHEQILEVEKEGVMTDIIYSKKDSLHEHRNNNIRETTLPEKTFQRTNNQSTDSSEVVSKNLGNDSEEKLDEEGPITEASRTLTNTARKKSAADTSQEQTTSLDHLMKLLSKRKNLLSGMVDDVTTLADKSSATTNQITSKDATFSNEDDAVFVKERNEILLNKPSDLSSSKDDTTQTSSRLKSTRSSSVKHSPKNAAITSNKKPLPKSALERVGAILKTWVAPETNAYLQSSQVGSSNSSDSPTSFLDPRVQQGYVNLCQRLDAQQKDFEDLISDTGDQLDEDSGKASKSLPDYSVLKKEAEMFQLRVTEFLTGKKPQVEDKKEEDEGKEPVYIPTVDSYDQRQIRIKIVLDRLDKFLPDLLAPLHLSVQDVSSLIREFVYTCRLEKHNIVFNPSEWTLVAIFILKLLGKRSKNIATVFSEESAIRHFSILLKGIGHTFEDLDAVTEDILSS